MTDLNEHRETFVHFLMARNKFYRKEILEAYGSDEVNQKVHDGYNHFQKGLKCFQKKFEFDRYYCIYYNSLVGKALNINLLGPLKIPLPSFPSYDDLSLGDYNYIKSIRDEQNRDILPIIESADNEVNKLKGDTIKRNWEKWRNLEVFLHKKFKPDFKKLPEIEKTDLFKIIDELSKSDGLSKSNEGKGWFKGKDGEAFNKQPDFDLQKVHEANNLYTSFYGKYLIAPHLTNNHYGAFIIVYVKNHYEEEENEDEKVVMLLDGIAGMYWIHLADQIDDDLKKYHEQTGALRLSDTEYRAVKGHVIELTQRLDEANAISARIRSQIDPTWQNLGAVASVFSLYLDENAKKIEYNKNDGHLRQVKADRTGEADWIELKEETAHDGHPIYECEKEDEKNNEGTPAHLIETVFQKNKLLHPTKKYETLKKYIWSTFNEKKDDDAKKRQKVFKVLLGRRTGEMQLVQLMWGLDIAAEENDISRYIYISHNSGDANLLSEKMISEPNLMLGKKCPLANDTNSMSFLNAIHELIVFILKDSDSERKKVTLKSIFTLYQESKDNEQDNVVVIFFCRYAFGEPPELLFINRPRDERKDHDTGRVVDMLCEATTISGSRYEPTPLIKNHNDEEVEIWTGKDGFTGRKGHVETFLENPLGQFIKNEMPPGCVISTGTGTNEKTTVIALKLGIVKGE